MSTITVASTAALTSALAAAHGGDSILLQPGTYSGLSIFNMDFGSGVTIASADPTHQAVLTNFNTNTVQGLTFSHLDFEVQTPAFVGFNVYSSSHISFDHDHVYGPAGAPNPDVFGISVFDSSFLSFTNNEIEQVAHGLSIARSDNIVVSGNNIHDVNADTLDFVQVGNAVISGNALHDFYPTNGNHPDAMQFATANSTTSSHDITISGNLIYNGAGQNAQGIFMGDELGNMPFLNVTITDNTVVGTGSSGLRPTHVIGLTMTGNDLVTLAGGNPTTLLVQTSDQVTSANNSSSSLSLTAANGNTNITETNDVGNAATVSDQGASIIQQWFATHTVGPGGQVLAVNHAPSGADTTEALAWNTAKVFASADFGFSDSDGNHLSAVKLDVLPNLGSLTDNGVAVSAGQVVSAADITAGHLVYHGPSAATAAHVDLTFQVQDDGGTANGGVDLDQTANTLHFDISAQSAPAPVAPVAPVTPVASGSTPTATPPATPPATETAAQTAPTAGENLVVTAGQNQLTGGSGDDTMTGGATDDFMHGGAGNDIINGGGAFDDINGMQGNDTAHGNGGDDWVVGGKGDDVLFGDAGGDIVWGNIGNDTLDGGDGDDQVRGGQGDDSISGGAGNDFISGDLGNDTESGGAGADTFHGSQNIGIDRIVDFNQAEGDHILLDAGTTFSVTQIGADTVVVMGGGNEMILAGVQMSSLHDGWLTVG